MAEGNITLGIVGGGRGGLEMFQLFERSGLVSIEYIVDRNPEAPALIYAKSKRVRTYYDLRKAVQAVKVDYIIEATGSLKVLELIRESAYDGVEIITGKTALFFFNVVEDIRKKEAEQFMKGINININGCIDEINNSLGKINSISGNLNNLSINARIEASRAGSHGAGFAVVAKEVGTSAGKVKTLVKEVAGINKRIKSVAEEVARNMN